MGKFQDLTGRRFGRLLVLHRAANRKDKVTWMCRCDCGTEEPIPAVQLTHDETRSCGCFRKREPRRQAIEIILRNYKAGAKKRGLSWNISDEAAIHLFAGECYYCGLPPNNQWRLPRSSQVALFYNGIDRKDTKRGYEPDNVVSCCGPCNLQKRTQGLEEFLDRTHRIAARHPRVLISKSGSREEQWTR
jgi:hypothetical protein